MIVGVDVSSKRIDLAWLDLKGRPCRWHQQLDPKAHLIDRLRSIDIIWPRFIAGEDTTDVAIELPFARQRNAVAALMATVGVITRQAPTWARVAWPSSGELRAAIGARNSKVAAHGALMNKATVPHWGQLIDWDEHELDALVACLGWTRILQQQDAA